MSQSKGAAPRRRKVPGPVGLLPSFTTDKPEVIQAPASGGFSFPKVVPFSDVSHSLQSSPIPKNNERSVHETVKTSRSEESHLGTIRSMCGSEVWSLVEKYSIARCVQMFTSGRLPRSKVPIMCGYLDEVELLPTDAKAVLRDETGGYSPKYMLTELGCIGCTIHRGVIKKHKDILLSRVLVLLKQVSLFSPTGKKFYINLTLSNIVLVCPLDQPFPSSSHNVPLVPPIALEELTKLEADFVDSFSTTESLAAKGAVLPREPTHLKNSYPFGTTNTSEIIRSPLSTYRIRPGLGSIVNLRKEPTPRVSSSKSFPNNCTSESLDLVPDASSKASDLLDDGMDDFLRTIAEESFSSANG